MRKPKPPKQSINTSERNLIAGHADVAPNTVRSWADGGNVRGSSRRRIERACKALGIETKGEG